MGTVSKLYVSNNTWIYVYIKKTLQNFNSNSNSREFQLQFQLLLREFQLQLQLRQISWISTPTPTPTPGVSTPTPTPANLQNINSNSNSAGFNSNSNSNSGVGVEPNSNSNSGVDPNPGWRITKSIWWHSPESKFRRSAHESNLLHMIWNYTVKITTISSVASNLKCCHFSLDLWINLTYSYGGQTHKGSPGGRRPWNYSLRHRMLPAGSEHFVLLRLA